MHFPLLIGPSEKVFSPRTAQVRAAIDRDHLAVDVTGTIGHQKAREVRKLLMVPDTAERIPAVRHVDGTARIQTINRAQNARYYDLLQAFARRSGVPVLINTSFNTRGEPVVCTPRDAVESFCTTPLDALAIGSFIVEKQVAG